MFGKKAMCKHNYAVLKKLGYGSLSEYINKFSQVSSFWRNGGNLTSQGDEEFTRFHGYA